mmetsp:Transcript_17082/g.47314  ORF Transcript_17082/g.47314 Transcript_17082/m.47314 type:complete len:228 (+) Transcript_17082:1668-2351(+)
MFAGTRTFHHVQSAPSPDARTVPTMPTFLLYRCCFHYSCFGRRVHSHCATPCGCSLIIAHYALITSHKCCYCFNARRNRTIFITVPPSDDPSGSSTVNVPPILDIMFRAMSKPIPVPSTDCVSRLRYPRRKTNSRSSLAMPGPLSSTRMVTPGLITFWSLDRKRTMICGDGLRDCADPRFGSTTYFSALSSRFIKASFKALGETETPGRSSSSSMTPNATPASSLTV